MKSLDSEWRERQCRTGGKMDLKQYDKLGVSSPEASNFPSRIRTEKPAGEPLGGWDGGGAWDEGDMVGEKV